jgi:hypothetical protein
VFPLLAQKPRYAPPVLAQGLGVACFGLAAFLPRTLEPRASLARMVLPLTRLNPLYAPLLAPDRSPPLGSCSCAHMPTPPASVPCLSCALLCSAAHALLHPRTRICHTLADSLCPRSNQAALHRRFPPSASLPRPSTRARATWAYSCPHRQLPCAIACTLAPPARRRAALRAMAAALFHPNVASAAHQPACVACCLRRGSTYTVCSHALCSSTNTV